MISYFDNILTLAAMLVIAIASGLVGVFALTRRMTLAADAISHVALPGLGLAVLIGINPLIGGAAALFSGAVLVWLLEKKTGITTETIIGVVFTASLAIGSLLIPSDETLLEALFGNFDAITVTEASIGIAAATAVIFLVISFKEKFTLAFISSDLAKTAGLNVSQLNFIFLMMFAATIVLGLKFLGVLLMGSLIIVPAATSRNLARSFNSDLLVSMISALLSVILGFFIAQTYKSAIGPTIISVAVALFFLSIFFKRKRN